MANKPTDALPHDHRRTRRPPTDKRLRRSEERVLGGVVGGIAEFLNMRPLPLRIGAMLGIPLTGGIIIIGYVLLWLILPGPARAASRP